MIRGAFPSFVVKERDHEPKPEPELPVLWTEWVRLREHAAPGRRVLLRQDVSV